MKHPVFETLSVETDKGVLHATLNRPEARNAMNVAMVRELTELAGFANEHADVRALVIRGAAGNFCAGGDIKDMARIRQADGSGDPAADYNRGFGTMLTALSRTRAAVVAVLEGAVLGGGFGLACISDVAIAHRDAKFGLPETGLGLPPAQIAPFVVARIGLTQARRLGVCGGRFDGEEARRLGLVHFCESDESAVAVRLDETLGQIRRCAPNANAITKALMLRVGNEELEPLLDDAARQFSECVRSDEGKEGTAAFIEKRLPGWAE
ncbi:enoyl-CoA hydratase-related protein [Salinisphaera sp. P385]|uniref:Enoyl-CoA hydratase-related protein n=1 Tax=Spectribacter acetivorans TaxID=3075603 RepID=A0ABU3B656_9GAMM|nr:enoyl-CoA hydratase-related protein [Salinisphaera sp. P385]MDT0617540.1 enoyl-CoA hydratase-related protein [Salinisphaera sp. P385]